MPQETIPIVIEGREFYDGDSSNGLWRALKACKKANYNALFMPEIAYARINSQKDARIWQKWYLTPSVRVTGRTKQKTPVVIYAHVPNYFSNPENIMKAVYSKNLDNGAGIMPDKEFQKLIKLEDGINVFVVDYYKLKNSANGGFSVDDALEHPQTIPFLGGQERAEAYLKRHREVYGDDIGVINHDDLSDKGALGRLLSVGNYLQYFNHGNLDFLFVGDGRFVGVPVGAEGAAPKILAPSLSDILKYSKDFVPKAAREAYEAGLKARLRK